MKILDKLSRENGSLWYVSGFAVYEIISKLIDPIDTIGENKDIESSKFLSIVATVKSISETDNIFKIFSHSKCLSTSSCHLEKSSGRKLRIILSFERLSDKSSRVATSRINGSSLVWASSVGGYIGWSII